MTEVVIYQHEPHKPITFVKFRFAKPRDAVKFLDVYLDNIPNITSVTINSIDNIEEKYEENKVFRNFKQGIPTNGRYFR